MDCELEGVMNPDFDTHILKANERRAQQLWEAN